MEQNTAAFKHNEIIWGKVASHPWWPGTINIHESRIDKKLYRVDFFGYPPSHSLLPLTRVMKYDEYAKLQCPENGRRVNPELKRAMSEASILLNTLQQSKASPNNKSVTNPSLFDTENTIASVFKPEEKASSEFIMLPPVFSLASLTCDQQISITEEVKQQKQPNKQSHKSNRYVRIHNRANLKQQVQFLLSKYSLETIPEPQKQKMTNQDKYTAKLIYKICKQTRSKQQSIQVALQLKDILTNAKQLKKFIRQQRAKIKEKE